MFLPGTYSESYIVFVKGDSLIIFVYICLFLCLHRFRRLMSYMLPDANKSLTFRRTFALRKHGFSIPLNSQQALNPFHCFSLPKGQTNFTRNDSKRPGFFLCVLQRILSSITVVTLWRHCSHWGIVTAHNQWTSQFLIYPMCCGYRLVCSATNR